MTKRPNRWLGRTLIGVPHYWALATSERAYHAELERLKVPRPWPDWVTPGKDATVHTFENVADVDKACQIICISAGEGRTGIEIACLLVHEAVHVWQEVRRWMNEREPSVEFEAYAIQSLSLELMQAYAETL